MLSASRRCPAPCRPVASAESQIPGQGLLIFKCAVKIATVADTGLPATSLPPLEILPGAQSATTSLLRITGTGAPAGSQSILFNTVPTGGTGVPTGPTG